MAEPWHASVLSRKAAKASRTQQDGQEGLQLPALLFPNRFCLFSQGSTSHIQVYRQRYRFVCMALYTCICMDTSIYTQLQRRPQNRLQITCNIDLLMYFSFILPPCVLIITAVCNGCLQNSFTRTCCKLRRHRKLRGTYKRDANIMVIF